MLLPEREAGEEERGGRRSEGRAVRRQRELLLSVLAKEGEGRDMACPGGG